MTLHLKTYLAIILMAAYFCLGVILLFIPTDFSYKNWLIGGSIFTPAAIFMNLKFPSESKEKRKDQIFKLFSIIPEIILKKFSPIGSISPTGAALGPSGAAIGPIDLTDIAKKVTDENLPEDRYEV